MIQAGIPVVAAVIGAFVYILSGNPKGAELGRITFWCGMLVFIHVLANVIAINY